MQFGLDLIKRIKIFKFELILLEKRIKGVAILSIIQLAWIVFNAKIDWYILGFWARENTLGKDLQYVALSVECDKKMDFWTPYISNDCDNFYGIVLIRMLRLSGFDSSNYIHLYFLLTGFTILTTSYLFFIFTSKLKSFYKVLWFLIAFGPYYLLLLHRGNIDQLIFCIFAISSMLYLRNQSKFFFLVLVMSSLIKFYSVPVLILHVFFFTKSGFFQKMISFFVFSEVLREIYLTDFSQIRNISSSFGLTIFVDYFAEFNRISPRFGLLFVLFIAFFTAFTFIFALRSQYQDTRDSNEISLSDYLFIQHIVCYVAFLNYDWRLIFLVFSLAAITGKTFRGCGLKYLTLAALIISWFSSGLNQLAFFGDLLLFALFIYRTFEVCIKQVSSRLNLGIQKPI